MKIKILTVGKPKISFFKQGFEEYTKRLQKFIKIEIKHFKDNTKEKEILKFVDKNFLVLLDEDGQELSSEELADFLNKKALSGNDNILFFVGGPDGHSDVIKRRANFLWSFGKMTFPHDLAMLILAEALYRAETINHNHPYHRF